MAGEPSPPPEEEQESEQEQEEVPFVDANVFGSNVMTVRAGWSTTGEDPEVTELVLNYQGPVGNAGQVLQSAYEWYVTRIQELAQRQQQQQE